jgi:type IV pilus assembly protein PilQ
MKYSQLPKLIIFIAFALAFQGCATVEPETSVPEQKSVLSKIEARDADGKTELVIEGTAPILQYTSFQLNDPLRLVVDISNADIGSFQEKITVNRGAILDIVPIQKDDIVRLEIAMAEAVDTKVNQSEGKLLVELAKPAGKSAEEIMTAPAVTAPEIATPVVVPQEEPKPEVVETSLPETATAKVVSSVKATAGKDGVKVVISGDGTMIPKAFMMGDKKLVVDIPGVKSNVRPSVIPVRKGGLDRVRVGQHAAPSQKVRVVMDLTKPLGYSIAPEGTSLVITMADAALMKTEAAAVKPEEKPATNTAAATEVKSDEKIPQERAEQGPERVPVVQREAAQLPEAVEAPVPRAKKEPRETAGPGKGSLEAGFVSGASKYTGRKISLELQDADLINVMRLFADVANLNIILASDVKGRVTVRMVNIPWDQAMDIILKMNGLGYALEDNILRIATVGALTKEAEDDLKAKEAKKKAEDLITRVIPINYSTASAVEGTLKKSLSPRGDIVTDARTNTLIIKDIARNIDEIVALIKLLDKPIPQVMIEARIVEASLNFNRSLGVQWGGQFTASAATGNPTGLSFPSSIGITGGPTMGQTPSGTGNFFVNMPAPAGAGTGGGAVGFTFGSLSKAVNLDLVLSALESTGEGKVISTPRVSALDNKEAKIEQGVSIPFSTASASGTQIQFIDAKLSLVVTPHATPDNKIFMKIQATKNAPDTSLLGASGQPSIRKNEASTEVLLADGETAVIGGILIIDRGVTVTKVPFFADIPLIGWLFKSKTNREEKRELIIFITPRIVRQELI